MARVRTAVVGVGYLGRFHAEKYATLPESQLVGVVDTDRERAASIASRLGTTAYSDYRELTDRIDAVSVVVPTDAHFEVADYFLRHGVHVLVEKPITTTLEQADRLIASARRHDRLLQVGHLERFNAALAALTDVINKPQFIESHRLAPFKARGTDVNVVLDLMIHDIDIILGIVDAPLKQISSIGVPVLTAAEDIANARLEFADGCVANVTASRVSYKTERKLRIFQSDAYISADLSEKRVAVYRRAGDAAPDELPDIDVDTRTYDDNDALYAQLQAFVQAVRNGAPPLVSGDDGKRALMIALEINAGLKR